MSQPTDSAAIAKERLQHHVTGVDEKFYISQATISEGTITDEITDEEKLIRAGVLRAALIEPESFRLPDHRIAQTGAEDLARFLAVTIRKVEELESTYQELLMQAHQYRDIDTRHLQIARNHLDIGQTFLLKALRNVEILDDGK
ncbi:hypothetical protein HOV23_gp129 [Pseudomonas phage Lana]|uniref:Uncharacterized protein n=1 Tax=Pseudomonas phage Lana TaxID=2530172 RepID=A0A481W5T4_9CAUD|nr:hypothetical protein HOV23_gp129 [Pseudomonas phage Lana]QBJ04444.1 hypothetical protein [Pseudomonas phage Lana]